MGIEEIVNQFVEKNRKEYPNIIAAIFYGSNCYHTASIHSDIDILFITKDGSDMRGKTIFEGKKIEYKMQTIASLEQECVSAISKQETFLWSVFQNGKVIYDANKIVEKYKKYFNLRYRMKLPKYEVNQKEKINLIQNWHDLCEKENVNFWLNYYNLLNRIRINYQSMKGYSRIPVSKVYHFYQNREYAQKFYCAQLPDEHFTTMFQKSIELQNQEEAKETMQAYAKFFTIEFPNIPSNDTEFKISQENYYQTPKMAILKETAAQLITKYEKTIEALLEQKPEKNFMYFIVLEQLRRFYEIQCGILNNSSKDALRNYQIKLQGHGISRLDSDFMLCYQKAVITKDSESQIKYLEKIFHYALKEIPINSEEYLIKLQR